MGGILVEDEEGSCFISWDFIARMIKGVESFISTSLGNIRKDRISLGILFSHEIGKSWI